jgi:hypothetical protein
MLVSPKEKKKNETCKYIVFFRTKEAYIPRVYISEEGRGRWTDAKVNARRGSGKEKKKRLVRRQHLANERGTCYLSRFQGY